MNDLGPRMRWLVYASVSSTIVWENVLPHIGVVGTKYNMVPACISTWKSIRFYTNVKWSDHTHCPQVRSSVPWPWA